MDYQKIYQSIIERAKSRNIEGYVERHHILPRCMKGSDDESNLVALTAREHFICHWILTKIYPKNRKLKYAFWMMAHCKDNKQDRYRCSSVAYEIARKAMNGKNNPFYGRTHTEESKAKMSASLKGKPIWASGRSFSKEHRSRISETRLKNGSSKGIKNPRSLGWYHTPAGKFDSSGDAAKANKLSHCTIRKWCRENKLGFSFTPKLSD